MLMGDVALRMHEQGRHEEAEKLHREVLELRRRVLGPKHPHTLVSVLSLASTMKKRHRYEEAIAVYSEAILLAPEMCDLYTLRAETYLAIDRFDDAVADCDSYLTKRPNHVFVALMRAQALLLADRADEYRRACLEVLNRFRQSEDADKQCLAARVCVLLPAAVPDPMVPVHLAEQSVARHATPWSLYTLAMTHLREGQLDEAARRFQQSLDAPSAWDARFLDRMGLALLHAKRGEAEASLRQLDGAMKLLAQNPDSFQQDRIEALLLLRELTSSRETVKQKKSDPQSASTN
jgi:tetratricopeptide (TPR) repeat protein